MALDAERAHGPMKFFAAPSPPPLALGNGTLWLIAGLIALGPFSLTMYQPALPAIAAGLKADTGQIQLTLSVFLTAFAVGQLFLGPLSDEFGRRRTLLIGLAIFVTGSLACMLSSSVTTLVAARTLQGLGACAGPALGRAMIRDLYGASGSARAMAYVSAPISIAPATAPLFGGYVSTFAGWQAIFGSLATVGFVMFAFVLLRVPETNPYTPEGDFRMGRLAESYLILLRSRRYLGFLFIAAAASSGFFAFQTAAPFIIIGDLGVSPTTFGWLLVSLPAGFVTGTLVTGRLVGRHRAERIILLGGLLLILGSSIQLACALAHIVTVTTLMSSQVIWAFGFGILMPSAMAGAVVPFPTMAGAATSLQGFAMMAGGALCSVLLAQITVGAVAVGIIMLAVATAGVVIFAATAKLQPYE